MDRLNELLAAPDTVLISDMEYMEHVISKYPYFQAAQSIYLKCLKKNNSPLYIKQLQKTAAHTTDRSVLFDFINSDGLQQTNTSNQIKDRENNLEEIEVDGEEVKARQQDLNEDSDFTQVTDTDLFERKTDITTTPRDVPKSEAHSFNEWLKLSTLKPISRAQEDTVKKTPPNLEERLRLNKMKRIDQFLADKPKISPAREKITLKEIDVNHNSSTQLMTETLAQVYIAQKNYDKAIKSYQILVLQHPEKSSFFADQIQKVKNLQSSN
jgi:hypothetical protein